MNKQYQNDLEASLYYANEEIKKLKQERQEALEFIEKRCTFDNHLQGFCMGLSAGEVKTLVLKMGGLAK